MENNKIVKAIDKRLGQMQLTEEMEKQILAQKRQQAKNARPLTVILAACLCILIAVPALAVTVPAFRRFLGGVKTDIVQLLRPVELVSESSGIRMEVLAAANDDDSVVAFVTMKDLAGGEINGKVDLYDYYISGLQMFTHYAVANDDPQTALLCIMATGGSGMNGRKVTLQVDSFLSGRKVFDTFDTEVDLLKVGAGQSVPVKEMDQVNGGSGEVMEAHHRREEVKVLEIGKMDISLPKVDFAVISNIGIIDGQLHVQTKWPRKLYKDEHIDDHGWFYLENEKGNRIRPDGISYRQDGVQYEEYIFDIADFAGYRLYAESMTTNERFVQGNWEVTFPISAVKEPKNIKTDVELGEARIDTVSLSPLGVTLSGTGNAWPEDMKLEIRLKDGSVAKHNYMADLSADGKVCRKYIPGGELLEPDEVAAIIINGVEVVP